jgi:HPt (histidine-containing phosphotransfer) domain-containing protein
MTACAMEGDRRKCLEAGMDDYLTKPIRPDTMAGMLARWLSGKEDADQVDEAPADICENDPGQAQDQKNIFDPEDFLRRLMTDKASARPIVAGFLADLSRYAMALKSHLRSGDGPAVHRQAHTIKGAAANVGCYRLKKAADEMEMAGKAGDLEQASVLLTGLEEQIELLRDVMKQTGWI